MSECADDLSMNYAIELDNDESNDKEMCYCGRMVKEEDRIFDGIKNICKYCEYE